MQLTTSAPCSPNTAYTIGGVSWAAKRRIQRKALHRCRKTMSPIANTVQYNCLTRELWTDEKIEWCCANKGLGCSSPPNK